MASGVRGVCLWWGHGGAVSGVVMDSIVLE